MAGERILLVEGKDDEVVVCNLCERRNIPEVFTIKQKTGVESLLESIPVEMKGSDVERLAVILDADQDPRADGNNSDRCFAENSASYYRSVQLRLEH